MCCSACCGPGQESQVPDHPLQPTHLAHEEVDGALLGHDLGQLEQLLQRLAVPLAAVQDRGPLELAQGVPATNRY